MGLDYLDQIIIHSPQPWVEVNQSENRYKEENRAVWKALEDAYKAKKVRVIGVSNFLQEDIENLLEVAEVKPMVNQVLCHISNTPSELVEYCQKMELQWKHILQSHTVRSYISRRSRQWQTGMEYLFHSFASVIHYSLEPFLFQRLQTQTI